MSLAETREHIRKINEQLLDLKGIAESASETDMMEFASECLSIANLALRYVEQKVAKRQAEEPEEEDEDWEDDEE